MATRYDSSKETLGMFGKIFKKLTPTTNPLKSNIDKATTKSQILVNDIEKLRAMEIKELQKLYSDEEIMNKYGYSLDEMNRFNQINHSDNIGVKYNNDATSDNLKPSM